LNSIGAGIVTIREKEYPPLLKNIPDPPIVLYKKGPLEAGMNTLAIVGSRKATSEGMNLAEKIGETLSSVGITIVSGLARGIDAAAHRGALKEKGKTVAVLGCGIDICYPPENRLLFNTTGEEGLILTEYEPGEEPLPYHFPERNRIIAGLSKGVLVIEASQKSGSLITARLGLEYGREVMAVPGSVFREEYKGANALIKQGAKLVENINDILTTSFPGYELEQKEPVMVTPEEEKVFSHIGFEKVHIDEIIEKSNMKAQQVMAMLTRLEMKEIIREVPGGFYIRK
jgi:DNA processing protein